MLQSSERARGGLKLFFVSSQLYQIIPRTASSLAPDE